MVLRRGLLRIDEASLFETFGSLKIRNFGYTLSCLQLLGKSMSNFTLFILYFSFSFLQKSLTATFPYFRAKSLPIFTIFYDNTKLKIVCKIIFIISALIISIFYCLNYTSLLIHLIRTHLVNISYNNYVINICPRQLL